jgi:hypothetical protein
VENSVKILVNLALNSKSNSIGIIGEFLELTSDTYGIGLYFDDELTDIFYGILQKMTKIRCTTRPRITIRLTTDSFRLNLCYHRILNLLDEKPKI